MINVPVNHHWSMFRDANRQAGTLKDPPGAMTAYYTGYHAAIMDVMMLVANTKRRGEVLATLRDVSLSMADKLLVDFLGEGPRG